MTGRGAFGKQWQAVVTCLGLCGGRGRVPLSQSTKLRRVLHTRPPVEMVLHLCSATGGG